MTPFPHRQNHGPVRTCRDCTHFRLVEGECMLGRCSVRPPRGELMEPDEALTHPGKVYVFPLVAKGDVCSAFNPIPCVREAISIKECTERIADVFHRWHCLKGSDVPMPGWLFNRKVKNFSPDVLALAKDRLVKQEMLECILIMNNGKSGLAYRLKSTMNNGAEGKSNGKLETHPRPSGI